MEQQLKQQIRSQLPVIEEESEVFSDQETKDLENFVDDDDQFVENYELLGNMKKKN